MNPDFAALLDVEALKTRTIVSEFVAFLRSNSCVIGKPSFAAETPEMQSNRAMYTPRKTSLRFNCFQDIMLLREVVSQNPFGSTLKRPWESIAAALNTYMPSVPGKTCKERVFRLLKMHRENDTVNLRRWGNQEQYEEREELLLVVRELEEKKMSHVEEETCTAARQEAEDAESATIEHIREATIMASLSPAVTMVTDNSPVPSTSDLDTESEHDSKRRRKAVSKGLAAFLRKKHAAETRLREDELQFRKEQLEVDKRRLDLEERKLELAAERWNVEKEERKEEKRMMMELIQMVMKK